MSGLARHACLLVALGSAACTVNNPAFGLSTDGAGGTGDSTGNAASTGAPGTTDPDTTASPPTTTGDPTSPGSTTVEPGTTAMSSTTAPQPFCGDDHVDPGEACDDGNNIDGDGCQADCSLVSCGDGVLQGAEQCDDANMVDEDSCLSNCVAASCGDGFVHAGVEECDDANLDEGDGCNPFCAKEICGDGKVDAGEECDDGNQIDNDDCTNACKKATCGDGIVSQSEKCDDGNKIDTDTCTNLCTPGPCGNLVWDPNTEPCDASAEPFKSYPGLCSDACTLKTCAKIVNTADTDIKTNNWFDSCVDADGATIHVVVVSNLNNIVYKASGPKSPNWTYDNITSDQTPELQHLFVGHLPISMNNGDRMLIYGRSGKPLAVDKVACPTSLGDGYGVAILPKQGDAPKLLVMSTDGGNTLKLRNFTNWSGAHEISYNALGMPLCLMAGPTPVTGHTAYFLVK